MTRASHSYKHQEHAVSRLQVFQPVQRQEEPAWRRKLAAEMDLDSLGTFIVNHRVGKEWTKHPSHGALSLVDGQHRRGALLDLDLGDWVVDCKVFSGLTEAAEAALFRAHNRSRRVNRVDDFLVGVTEEDPECVAIDAIVRRVGLRVARYKSDGTIACVKELGDVLRGFEPNGDEAHAETLEAALVTLRDSWGLTSAAFEALLVSGVGRVFLRYNGGIDRAVMVDKLAKFPGGAPAFIGRAKGLAAMQVGTSARQAAAQLVVDVYNHRRRTNLLPPL